jgi:hypothetical protein
VGGRAGIIYERRISEQRQRAFFKLVLDQRGKQRKACWLCACKRRQAHDACQCVCVCVCVLRNGGCMGERV